MRPAMRLFKMAELFAVSKLNISMLIAKIFAENELDDSVVKFYLTTAADGKRYNVIYYALGVTLPSAPPSSRRAFPPCVITKKGKL